MDEADAVDETGQRAQRAGQRKMGLVCNIAAPSGKSVGLFYFAGAKPVQIPKSGTIAASGTLQEIQIPHFEEPVMTSVTYEIVEHDGGWAYKVNNVFSEAYPTHAAAAAAAKRAAAHQQAPGETEVIQYEDAQGKWHQETSRGNDRPKTDVIDKA